MKPQGYIDKNLIHNSSLACFLLTSFVKKYEEKTAGTETPELLKILLVLPIIWHRDSCDAIKRRNFSTPIQAVLAECPLIKIQFKERMEAFAEVSFQGLNLACATGLLKKDTFNSKTYMSSAFDQWPRGSKPSSIPADMLNAMERLAVWFKDASTAQLYSQFLEE